MLTTAHRGLTIAEVDAYHADARLRGFDHAEATVILEAAVDRFARGECVDPIGFAVTMMELRR